MLPRAKPLGLCRERATSKRQFLGGPQSPGSTTDKESVRSFCANNVYCC